MVEINSSSQTPDLSRGKGRMSRLVKVAVLLCVSCVSLATVVLLLSALGHRADETFEKNIRDYIRSQQTPASSLLSAGAELLCRPDDKGNYGVTIAKAGVAGEMLIATLTVQTRDNRIHIERHSMLLITAMVSNADGGEQVNTYWGVVVPPDLEIQVSDRICKRIEARSMLQTHRLGKVAEFRAEYDFLVQIWKADGCEGSANGVAGQRPAPPSDPPPSVP